jgi:hypothetical protein
VAAGLWGDSQRLVFFRDAAGQQAGSEGETDNHFDFHGGSFLSAICWLSKSELCH